MDILEECARLSGLVRERSPLVHQITNYVTVNDCANVTLAAGASPIMADAVEEVEEIAKLASALVLNIGTFNIRTAESMLKAGKAANAKGIPVVLDPVGAGASALRTGWAARLLEEIRIAVVRGNISEVATLAGVAAHTKGVDAGSVDKNSNAAAIAADFAAKRKCVVAITGARDTVSDGSRTVFIDNGVEALTRVSGTGCMCSALVGAFAGAEPGKTFEATVAAVACMGIAGEIAFERAGGLGTGSFRTAIIDAVSLMDGNAFFEKGRVGETGH